MPVDPSPRQRSRDVVGLIAQQAERLDYLPPLDRGSSPRQAACLVEEVKEVSDARE